MPLSLSISSSIEASSLSFLSNELSWWWSSSFHGLFPSGWRLLSPLLLYLPLHLHNWKSPLKDLIEAQRSNLYRSFSSKLQSYNPIVSITWTTYSPPNGLTTVSALLSFVLTRAPNTYISALIRGEYCDPLWNNSFLMASSNSCFIFSRLSLFSSSTLP